MNEDFWLVAPVAIVWAILAVAYAVAPWGDMIGYAWVWGFGALLFAGLAVLLGREHPPTAHDATPPDAPRA
jgi:hypothetical protein